MQILLIDFNFDMCQFLFLSFQATHSQPIYGYVVILTRQRILYIIFGIPKSTEMLGGGGVATEM